MSDIAEKLRALAPTVEDRLDNDEAGDALLEAAAEIKRLRALNAEMVEVLRDIGVYGCGMLNQPAALNGPEEEWLQKRIAEYERRARALLAKAEGGQ